MELLILGAIIGFCLCAVLLFASSYESIIDDAVEEEWLRYNIRKDKEEV